MYAVRYASVQLLCLLGWYIGTLPGAGARAHANSLDIWFRIPQLQSALQRQLSG